MRLKFCIIALLIIVSLATLAGVANADTGIVNAKSEAGKAAAGTPLANAKIADLPVLVGTIFQVVLAMVGVLFVILVIWGGISWMLASGDSAKITKAKGLLMAAAIGLIITMISYTITIFVLEGVGVVQTKGTGTEKDTQNRPSDNIIDPNRPDNPADDWTLYP
ncbi:MAG: hypothetical protein WC610_01090 [Patescibacteria group bacterium]